MAETDWHRDLMVALIQMLEYFFRNEPRVYVSGNLLVFYEQGNRRRHVSPDVFMVRGVPKVQRPNYLVWEERRGPQVVIELTSSSTRREDLTTKFDLYRDTLRVREYFLFDPRGDYLEPRLQGYRLRQDVYRPIRLADGRLPSQVLGLHLEPEGQNLRLFDPQSGQWLLTPAERVEQEHERAERAEQQRKQTEQENQRLREIIEQLRQQPPAPPPEPPGGSAPGQR
jgi:Uma2 family endonuclease